MSPREDRRKFPHQTGLAGLALVTPRWGHLQPQKESKKEEEVSPAEDLMREHGLLNRVLLVYEEVDRRLKARTEFDPQILARAAGITSVSSRSITRSSKRTICSRASRRPAS
jgi:hypothetical protein